MARSRATEAFQKRELAGKGKRSNVVLQSQDVLERDEDGFEDEGVLFDAVQRGKENARQAKKPRFSLADSLNDSMSVASADVRNLRKRVASRTPSAFSPVSTAPPSDTRAPEDVEVTRTAQDRESTEGYIPPAAQASQPDYHDYDDAMPMPDDDDDDEMIPDEPPQSPSQEYGESQELQTQTEADFPVGMDDDDDDNDGPGFVAASDPAPSSPEEEPQEPVPAKKAKKTKKKVQIESSDESSVVRAPKPRKKQQKRVVFSPKGIQSGPREYEAVPVSDLKAFPPQDKKLRRSGRARVSPLEYWRGETCEYGPNDFGDDYVGVKNMPVVKAVVRAKPTPYKPRKERPPMAKKKKSSSKQVDQDTHIIADIPEFDSMKLRRRYDVIDGDHAVMWDDAMGEGVESKVVAYKKDLDESQRDLPVPASRPKADGKGVVYAAQAFNVPTDEDTPLVGYIMGNLTMPPKSVKDAEAVGLCAQTFTVVSAQRGSVELTFSKPGEPDHVVDPKTASRFLLGPGDMFRVPPGNSYRIQNHSKDTKCHLTWTIIRPMAQPED